MKPNYPNKGFKNYLETNGNYSTARASERMKELLWWNLGEGLRFWCLCKSQKEASVGWK